MAETTNNHSLGPVNLDYHRAVIKDDDKSLIIKNVIPSDEGIYICDAHNGVGQIGAKAQLVVNCK